MTAATRLAALALLLAATAALAADKADKDAVKKDRQAYQGTWQATRVVANGSEVKPEDAAKVTVVNEPDGHWQLLFDGEVKYKGTHTLDPAHKVRHIDMLVTEGDQKGKTYLGIYELAGDTRKVCYSEPGKDRPTAFESRPESGVILAEFKRVKK